MEKGREGRRGRREGKGGPLSEILNTPLPMTKKHPELVDLSLFLCDVEYVRMQDIGGPGKPTHL